MPTSYHNVHIGLSNSLQQPVERSLVLVFVRKFFHHSSSVSFEEMEIVNQIPIFFTITNKTVASDVRHFRHCIELTK